MKLKNDTVEMTAAIDEACIGMITWKLLFDEDDFSGVENEWFLSYWVGFIPIYIVSLKMVGLGKGAEQSIHGEGNKEDKSRGKFLVKWWIQVV